MFVATLQWQATGSDLSIKNYLIFSRNLRMRVYRNLVSVDNINSDLCEEGFQPDGVGFHGLN